MSLSANQLTSQVLDHLLRTPHAFAYRSNTLGIYDRARNAYRSAPKRGVPDITGIYRTHGFWIEVKVGRDRLRDEQKSFIDSVNNSGGVVMVVDTFESFLAQFEAYKKAVDLISTA